MQPNFDHMTSSNTDWFAEGFNGQSPRNWQ